MTTPERGLFERIEPFLEPLHPNSAWRNRIKAEIEKFQQRLAEAEANAKDAREKEQRAIREYIELTAEANQLRARCGELEGLIRDCNQSTSLLYGDFALCDCVDNTGEAYQSQYLADLLAQPTRELCTAHKRFPCRECGTTHFDGCQCGFCKQVEQEQIAK